MLALVVPVWAHAADLPATIHLQDAMARAAERTPGVRAAQAGADATQAGIDAAKGAWLPTLSLSGDFEVWNDKIEASFAPPGQTIDCSGVQPPMDAVCYALSSPIPVRDQVTANASIAVAQPLTGLLTADADTRSARAMGRAAERQVDATEADASMTAAQAWLDARGLEEQVDIAQSLVKSLQTRVEAARKTLEAHAVTKSDVLLAEVALGRGREGLIRATAMRDLAYRRLGVATGSPGTPLRPDPSDAVTPSTHASTPSEEALVATAIQHRPELEALRARIEGSDEHERSMSLSRIPDLSAVGVYTHEEGMGFVSEPNTVFVGARLQWLIYGGGRKMAGIRAARARTAQAKAQLEQATDGIRLQVEAALAQLTSAEAAYEVATDGVGQAQESLQAMEGRQQAGAATMTELLGAESDLVQAKSSKAAAAIEARRAELALTHAVGSDPWAAPMEPR